MTSKPNPRRSLLQRVQSRRLVGLALALLLGAPRFLGAAIPAQDGNPSTSAPDFIVLPNPSNAVQFRLYLNGSPSASHVFNTFDLEAYGESLLRSPDAA